MIATFFYGCDQVASEESNDLEESNPSNELIGVWWFDEWEVNNQDTSFYATDLYGQVIYTESHYSILWVDNEGLRENLLADKTWETFTKDELQKTIGLVTSNSGRYKIEGDSILFYRDVALYPGAMAKENQPLTLALPTITGDVAVYGGEGWTAKWVRRE